MRGNAATIRGEKISVKFLISLVLQYDQKETSFTDQITITPLLVFDVYFEKPPRLSCDQAISVRFNLN